MIFETLFKLPLISAKFFNLRSWEGHIICSTPTWTVFVLFALTLLHVWIKNMTILLFMCHVSGNSAWTISLKVTSRIILTNPRETKLKKDSGSLWNDFWWKIESFLGDQVVVGATVDRWRRVRMLWWLSPPRPGAVPWPPAAAKNPN